VVEDRDLYSGLIRLHVLHHACEEPVFGLGMIEELARHGYRISPGSLYPLLQGLEKKGYLRSTEVRNGKSLRRVYRATPLGHKALQVRSKRSVSCSTKLWKGNKHAPEFTQDFASLLYSCCPAACHAALRLTPSKPEADHGACSGQRRCAPAR
jgi:PadR family transcriptional regulator PadR